MVISYPVYLVVVIYLHEFQDLTNYDVHDLYDLIID